MATLTKLPSGKWQAKVRRQGINKTKSFLTHNLAKQWAKETEYQIEHGLFICTNSSEQTSLAELMCKYQQEVLPTKKSQKAIKTVIRTINPSLGAIRLISLSSSDIAGYRDQRLRTVSNETVRKELLFLRRLIDIALIDWGFNLPLGNPLNHVRLPNPGRARNRRLQEEEYVLFRDPKIGNYCILACETGMRRSEIANIRREHISISREGYTLLEIPETKTGIPRAIPLTKTALIALEGVLERKLKPDSISQTFSRVCQRFGIHGLRFHDLRHEATSRLFEKGLSIAEVASITGHADLKMLYRYTHITPSHLANRLDGSDYTG